MEEITNYTLKNEVEKNFNLVVKKMDIIFLHIDGLKCDDVFVKI